MSRGRGRNPNENPGVKPVTKIELSESRPRLRILLAVILLVIGLAFMGISLYNCLSKDRGWTEIKASGNTGSTLSSDFVFLYDLGAAELSPGAEGRALENLYTELCLSGYRLFSGTEAFEGVHNLCTLNRHIGERVKVDPALYRALALLERYDNRLLFTAAFTPEWDNLFDTPEDTIAKTFDPYYNEELRAYFTELAHFTSSASHARIELLGEDTVRLVISEEYRAFASENGIETFADFGWARNAFAVDYVAEALIAQGYTRGTLSSQDGFIRALDSRPEMTYAYPLYAYHDTLVYRASSMRYTGQMSIVNLRTYAMGEQEPYYTYRDGTRRHPYLDVNDGMCKNACNELVAYAKEQGCAEVLMNVLPVFVTDTLSVPALSALAEQDIMYAYYEGTTLYYCDPAVTIEDLYMSDNVKFDRVLED